MGDDEEKKGWRTEGVNRKYRWANPLVNNAIEDLRSGKFLAKGDSLAVVCTAGTAESREQCSELVMALTELGWRVLVIQGVHPDDLPPKSWKIGCKASFAWWAQLAPTIQTIAAALPKYTRFLWGEIRSPSSGGCQTFLWRLNVLGIGEYDV